MERSSHVCGWDTAVKRCRWDLGRCVFQMAKGNDDWFANEQQYVAEIMECT